MALNLAADLSFDNFGDLMDLDLDLEREKELVKLKRKIFIVDH